MSGHWIDQPRGPDGKWIPTGAFYSSQGFKQGSYAIHGSRVLEAHGARPARDIDIVVSPKVYKEFQRSEDYSRAPYSNRTLIAKNYKGEVSRANLIRTPSMRDIKNADSMYGASYLSLEKLEAEKRRSVRKRHRTQKDLQDLQLLRDLRK